MSEHPTVCNLSGGKVSLVTNDKIYGWTYGNGLDYLCENCGAYVGTHTGTDRALGILADKEMRTMKKK